MSRLCLEHLWIRAVRNLEPTDLDLAPGLNGFAGINGAGKTSILEAVHLLGAGKSFRTTVSGHYIRHGEDCAQVSVRLLEDGEPRQLGMERCRQKILLRQNGERVEKLSDFVRHLPVLALHPDSDALISGSPEHRRRFIDRGVFHANADFAIQIGRYQRLLRQRNAALRSGGDETPWEPALIQAGELIDQFRRQFIDELQQVMTSLCERLPGHPTVELRYQGGYRRELSFQEAIRQSRGRDRDMGSTQVGPHRANLAIRLDGHLADITASRGQIKTLVSALTLAMLELWRETYGRVAVVLFDDLPSELDRRHFEFLVEQLRQSGHQALITAVEQTALQGTVDRLFEVRQGRVTRL